MTAAADPATWDAEAPTFDEAADHGLLDPVTRAAWADLLSGFLPEPPAAVADLGCGTGTLSLLLADAGHRVDALDFSPEMVRHARDKLRRTGVTPRVGDAADPGLADASLDAVLCRHVLWALPEPDVALRRWVRALRPGGLLVLVEGDWSTGAGLTAGAARALVRPHAADVEVRPLTDPVLWGRETDDERYLLLARP
ncbi:class I SAM-dependent methyltransferase [Phycicoccus sp. CSK15P-2]|uniref:class I SAM-dependent methyltransferase n=1 Tax=Phycicoccus sp. CSK15P-2 TaxID=2807627 RepID=UPI0019529DE1|nr:class I SAM-dependent methyltransferase [Phycicoccus sp. CSK15P-2]MBM6403913.1 class I SAM-dependent methyltransferase [Phycicoccus sp. CSK15P-2]